MTQLASDDFNRANSATLGSNWSEWGAGNLFEIFSNQARGLEAHFADTHAVWNQGTWPGDHWSEAKCYANNVSGGTGAGPGILVRTNTANDSQRYRVAIGHEASNNVELAKHTTGGGYVFVASRTSAFTEGDTLRLEVEGTTLRIYKNGTQLGANITDSSLSGGRPGIFVSSGGFTNTDCKLDDWAGGDFAVTAMPELYGRSGLRSDRQMRQLLAT